MSLDGAIWDLVRDHERAGDAPQPCEDQQALLAAEARRDALIRVLDAAVGVLESTRILIVVAAESLSEHRDRVAAALPKQLEDRETDPPRATRQHIDLTF